jgi:flagellar biosynthesis/type III secretory pathway chaperone
MNEFVEQLISVVAMEAEHCERLLTLLRQQQRHLIEGKTEALQANVREQEAAIRRSRDLESRRQSLVKTIAQRQNLDNDLPNLSALIATLSDDYGRRLSALRTSMAQSIERLSKTKEQNKMLIERSLTNINEIMHMLAAANVAAGEYNGQPNGKTASAAAPLSVDRVG